MNALKLDDTGDIDFDENTGVFSTVADNDEIQQHLDILLGINLGELAWNEEIGLNQNDVIINGDSQSAVQSILDSYLKDQIGESYGGISIDTFSVDYSQRLTALSASVTIDGQKYVTDLSAENSDDENGDDSNGTDE